MGVIIITLLVACSTRRSPGTPPGLDGNEMYGQSDMEWVLENIVIFRTRTDLIRPDREAVRFLSQLRERITIKVFMGTWSVDAQIHAPELFSALQETGNRRVTVEVIGLDRRCRDRDGLSLTYGIVAPFTLVVEQNGIELGRVIETPVRDAASDVVAILQTSLGR
jgi:hypothetical protein